MNDFVLKFGEAIAEFYDVEEEKKKRTLTEVLRYANSNQQSFKEDLKEVQFDRKLAPLPIVLEALSKDTDIWGELYVDILDQIFKKAYQSNPAGEILTFLHEFAYIEKDDRPFVQKIADRVYKEIDSENITIRLAAIQMLPNFLNNTVVKNKALFLEGCQRNLHCNNWKVRYVAFKYLGYENLLPKGQKLSWKDKLLKQIFGEPSIV